VSSVVDIRAALEARLNAISPALATSWENLNFAPSDETAPYQEIFLLMAEPTNAEYGPLFIEQGLLQVTLCYPLGAGPKDAMNRAQQVRDQFKRGLSLPKNGVVVIIEKTPEIGIAQIDDARYRLPVRVRWYANVVA